MNMKRSVINVLLFSFMVLAAVACTAGGGEGAIDKTENTSVSESSISESNVSSDETEALSEVYSLEFSKAGGFYEC